MTLKVTLNTCMKKLLRFNVTMKKVGPLPEGSVSSPLFWLWLVSVWFFLLLFLHPTECFRRLFCISIVLTLNLIYLKECLILSRVVYKDISYQGSQKWMRLLDVKSRETPTITSDKSGQVPPSPLYQSVTGEFKFFLLLLGLDSP